MGRAGALLSACRPKQWLKNLLVFAAPGAAGQLGDPDALARTAAVFVVFCVAASGTYLLNDVRDADRDREHERKRHRPVAAGALPVGWAASAGVLLIAAALLAVAAAGDPPVLAVLTGYLALTGAYTAVLKTITVCDIIAVAGCHVLRALAGAVAIGVPVTSWFLIVVSLAALLVVTGKREAELRGPAGTRTRATLARYTVSYLTQVRTMVSGALIVTFCLWALDGDGAGDPLPFRAASIVPFIACVLRYHMLVDRGIGEEPEEIALRDRGLQVGVLALLALVGLGAHLG
ncbi:decaprenyl-phosphate phosphoribosyltransferase [Nocardiopsis mangrovi]|uniref:Decaprenyl-phosphate phosphoribosyltransferase n=1 Tax=Nocardiopsis mangrovi TaxID=1179818 RepID=A0ABV9DUR3_9ACTN